MIKTKRIKKRWKIAGLLLACLVAIVTFLYYSIAFRLKETIQLIVEKESGGLYAFNASQVKVSLLDHYISIKHAQLTCKDTAVTSPHYDVQIPDVFLSLQSIRQMLVSKRLSIDSLSIALPSLKIHEHSKKSGSHAAFHVSRIFDVLQTLKSHLQIKSFSIHSASFDYKNTHHAAPFSSNRISLLVKNFSGKNHPDSSFLSSDDVDLSILNQQWKLPDGLHEVSFSKLHFSGSSQLFEIDSCSFNGRDKKDNLFSISADKLFFNSTQLAALYNKEALIIDTLILFKPVIALETNKQKRSADSSSNLITQSLKNIFRSINFKYIDIKDGSLQLTYKDDLQPAFTTRETHLKVYNLSIAEDSADVNIDSITLKQKNISLITKDSLFKLNIEEFAIQNNTVFLKNTSYGPTYKNLGGKIFKFKSPLLKLSNVNFEDLAIKRFTASSAELYQPEIDFRAEKHSSRKRSPKNTDRFYGVLNGLSELVNVKNFRIIGGNINFQSSGAEPMHVRAENIHLQVLLPRLFSSDSLIDIKRSLPMLAFGKLKLESPKVTLNVDEFSFKGDKGYNHADAFNLSLANGTDLHGKDLTWIIFDWDKYHQQKQFDLESMHIGELAVSTRKKEQAEKGHVAKDLPSIHLDRINIDKFSFGQPDSISFNGKKFFASNVHSLKHIFKWDYAGADIQDIVIDKPTFKAKIESLHFNSNAVTTITNSTFTTTNNTQQLNVSIPLIETGLRLHSSDFSNIHLATLNIMKPIVDFSKHGKTEHTNPVQSKTDTDKKPMEFSVGKMNMQQGRLNYRDEQGSKLETGFTVHAAQIQHVDDPEKLLGWELLGIQLEDAQFSKTETTVSLPSLNLDLNDGELTRSGKHFNAATKVKINIKNTQLSNYKNDSNYLSLKNISGVIAQHQIKINGGQKLPIEKLLAHLSVTVDSVTNKSSKTTISVAGVRYDGASEKMDIGSFAMVPNIDANTLFKNTGWQTSHTSINTGALRLAGFSAQSYLKDSVIRARYVHATDLKLITAKDKRYPFKHGLERPMLAQLINNLKVAIHIDSLRLENGSVYVHEITEKTHKEAIVPLKKINALATNIKNRNNSNDSIAVDASLALFNTKAHHFRYRESYSDSLAGFTLQLGVSPIVLPELSSLTMSFANVNIVSGRADTLFSVWSGNKYAAAGTMNFVYDDLKIRMMSKKDSSRSTLLERIGSFLANDIALHRKNDKPAFIFYVRDPEKSVFNYWVKTKLNGVLGSAAILQRKKHYKAYMKQRDKYYLPLIEY